MVLLEEYHHYNQTVHYNLIAYNEVHEEGNQTAHSKRKYRVAFNKYLVGSIAGSLTKGMNTDGRLKKKKQQKME